MCIRDRFTTNTNTRNITVQAFDETRPTERDFVANEITRAFALNFVSDAEIQSKLAQESDYFTQFRALSGWTANPDSFEEYSRAGDGNEFYLNDSNFVPEELATFNASQDFASVWRAVLDPDVSTESFADKAASIDGLFELLSE